MLEMIRDGRPVHELMLVGKEVLGVRQVLPGVAAALAEFQVEGTFPDGTKLLTVHNPICQLDVVLQTMQVTLEMLAAGGAHAIGALAIGWPGARM